MRITRDDPHYSQIAGQVRKSMSRAVTHDFRDGYEEFLDQFYVACLTQELQNEKEDGSTFIDLTHVTSSIHEEVKDRSPENPTEYWKGFFEAQQKAQELFALAYRKDCEVA